MTSPKPRSFEIVRPAPGDVIAIETAVGTRHAQVTHARSPYPDVVRAIRPRSDAQSPEEIAKGETAFVAMVELGRAMRDQSVTVTVIGHATVPAADRNFPTFRLPIRNKAGETIYWWTWDGDSLSVASDGTDSLMPIREILPSNALQERLAELST
ncbi:MAG: hypothetical protein JJ959_06960 [Nisaea sp.]|uniref:hypothetical protein n=1 Tax=Nisaea sp. TaxID=2024842 RepID=UPI001AFF6325|nr:hypothetical protein [Nisaea sp.]MBO6560259.1 hypothetical protein [Nisaea sp.]